MQLCPVYLLDAALLPASVEAAGLSAGAAASAGLPPAACAGWLAASFHGTGVTFFAPMPSLMKPSIMTLSPDFRPSVTTQLVPLDWLI
ncbi:hypothetical protein D3C72_2269010 [compost metagenome]